jgi:hypothetical protein
MVVIAKIFITYVFPSNLGLYMKKIHCSPGKVPTPQITWALPQEKFIAP